MSADIGEAGGQVMGLLGGSSRSCRSWTPIQKRFGENRVVVVKLTGVIVWCSLKG